MSDRGERSAGLVVVYTGNGKGKTTAALGMVFRALGRGLAVTVVQFIKGKWKTGEAEAFKRFPEITHIESGEGFTWNTQDRAKDIKAARSGWEAACSGIELARADPSQIQLIILDELSVVLHYDYLPLAEVLAVLHAVAVTIGASAEFPDARRGEAVVQRV